MSFRSAERTDQNDVDDFNSAPMEMVSSVDEVRRRIRVARRAGQRIGFVPTMGALHEGHLSLVEIGKESAEFIVLSIFVNPLQFDVPEDYANYPRLIEEDSERARASGVALLFTPHESELYRNGHEGCRVRAGIRAQGLCGASRPGHFDGVATVLSILFHVVQPDVAVFGEKDFQQLRVVEELVESLHFPVRIIAGPTVRDTDGLALSSRNLRLSPRERKGALSIPRALSQAREMVEQGEYSVERLLEITRQNLEQSLMLTIDYVAIVDSTTLTPLRVVDRPARLLVAASVGSVRLIDNIALRP